MKQRVVMAAAVLAVALSATVLLIRAGISGAARETAEERLARPRETGAPPAAHVARSRDGPAQLKRNLFEYADPTPVEMTAEPTEEPTALLLPTPEPPLRLVGLVRRSRVLKAALFVEGEVVVLGVGEQSGGYTVLSIDEDAGVRLRSPAGPEITLSPPES